MNEFSYRIRAEYDWGRGIAEYPVNATCRIGSAQNIQNAISNLLDVLFVRNERFYENSELPEREDILRLISMEYSDRLKSKPPKSRDLRTALAVNANIDHMPIDLSPLYDADEHYQMCELIDVFSMSFPIFFEERIYAYKDGPVRDYHQCLCDTRLEGATDLGNSQRDILNSCRARYWTVNWQMGFDLYCDSVAGVFKKATPDSIALDTMGFEGVIYIPKTEEDWSQLTSLQAIMAGK